MTISDGSSMAGGEGTWDRLRSMQEELREQESINEERGGQILQLEKELQEKEEVYKELFKSLDEQMKSMEEELARLELMGCLSGIPKRGEPTQNFADRIKAINSKAISMASRLASLDECEAANIEELMTVASIKLLPIPESFSIENEDGTPKPVILLPPLLLIDFDALREFLENDGTPRDMTEKSNFREFMAFMKEQTGLEFSFPNTLKLSSLMAYFEIVRRGQEEQVFDFILCHELGHILEGHVVDDESFSSRSATVFGTLSRIIGLKKFSNYLFTHSEAHEREYMADSYASKWEGAVEGGITLFTTMQQANIEARASSRRYSMAFTTSGHPRSEEFSHPNYSARLEQLLRV